jgi:hypothetical protein
MWTVDCNGSKWRASPHPCVLAGVLAMRPE